MEGFVRKVTRTPNSRQWARGTNSICQCPICGIWVNYPDMVNDWRGQWVCPDCNDQPPASYLQPVNPVDAVALEHFRGTPLDVNQEITQPGTELNVTVADTHEWAFGSTITNGSVSIIVDRAGGGMWNFMRSIYVPGVALTTYASGANNWLFKRTMYQNSVLLTVGFGIPYVYKTIDQNSVSIAIYPAGPNQWTIVSAITNNSVVISVETGIMTFDRYYPNPGIGMTISLGSVSFARAFVNDNVEYRLTDEGDARITDEGDIRISSDSRMISRAGTDWSFVIV